MYELRVVGLKRQKMCLSRRDSTVINRLKIGHTRLTHSCPLSREAPPECTTCQAPLTVQHFLLDCPHLTATRSTYFSVATLKDLYEQADIVRITDFSKDIQFYSRI